MRSRTWYKHRPWSSQPFISCYSGEVFSQPHLCNRVTFRWILFLSGRSDWEALGPAPGRLLGLRAMGVTIQPCQRSSGFVFRKLPCSVNESRCRLDEPGLVTAEQGRKWLNNTFFPLLCVSYFPSPCQEGDFQIDKVQ